MLVDYENRDLQNGTVLQEIPGFGQLSSFRNYIEGEYPEVKEFHQFLSLIAYHVQNNADAEVAQVFKEIGLPTGVEDQLSGPDWGKFCAGFVLFVVSVLQNGGRIN